MKKKFIAILMAVMSLSVTACGQTVSTTDNSEEIEELKEELEELKEENAELKAKLEEASTSTSDQKEETSELDSFVAETSGVCGADLTWEYGNGILRIHGTGEMTDYGIYNERPWQDISEKIGHIYIDEGVTSIGDRALGSLRSLSKLVIPSTVTSINIEDIASCEQLQELNLPDALRRIRKISTGDEPATWNELTEEEKEQRHKENLTKTFERFDAVSWKGKQYSVMEELVNDLEDAGVEFDY